MAELSGRYAGIRVPPASAAGSRSLESTCNLRKTLVTANGCEPFHLNRTQEVAGSIVGRAMSAKPDGVGLERHLDQQLAMLQHADPGDACDLHRWIAVLRRLVLD